MRHTSSVTSISWIPSEAMTGPMRLPMDLGIGHYDQAPPDRVSESDLAALRDADRYRFANHLSAWIDTDSGSVSDAGYNGDGYVGSTTAKIGVAITVPGVSFPLIQEPPKIHGDRAVFRQTAGGRTGAPLPHRIDRPPYVRMTGPTAWTTLQLSIYVDGGIDFEVIGASPFPRHWIYGPSGELAQKSGIIDYRQWTRKVDHVRTPWRDYDHPALMSHVESQVERNLSGVVMSSKPEILRYGTDELVISQGEPGGHISLIIDGMLEVDVDGKTIAELGPGAIVGERAVLEGGHATATVKAVTPVKAARIPAEAFERSDLEAIATGHRREED